MPPSYDDATTTPGALPNDLLSAGGIWRVGERGRTQSLLVLRFTLFNMTCLALVGAAWLQGWIDPLFAGTSKWMVGIICCVFALGLAWCTRLVLDTGAELDQVKSDRLRPTSRTAHHLTRLVGAGKTKQRAFEAALKIKLAGRIAGVRHVAGSLVFLGLIGTVLGFMIALSGVDAATAGDPKVIAPMVASLIDGMGVALHTTLVGAVLNLWLMSNYRFLEHGTAKLMAELIERGAVDAVE